MEDCRPMSTPMVTNWKKLHASEGELVDPTLYRHLIGPLMYPVKTKLYLCFAINTLSQFMTDPKRVHWIAAKHVLRYLDGTLDYGVDCRRSNGVSLICFMDLDWPSNVTDQKSTFGYCFTLGSTIVSWFSRKQKFVALSSVEAEYMAAS